MDVEIYNSPFFQGGEGIGRNRSFLRSDDGEGSSNPHLSGTTRPGDSIGHSSLEVPEGSPKTPSYYSIPFSKRRKRIEAVLTIVPYIFYIVFCHKKD